MNPETTTEALPLPGPFSTSELFQLSGMSDSLRDLSTSWVTAQIDVPEDALHLMAEQYRSVRADIVTALTAAGDTRGADLIPELPAGTPTAAWIAVAATQLSRWADLVHSTPAFLLSQQVAAANAHAVGNKVRESLAEVSVPDLPDNVRNIGAYL